ncbi:hypothetical protein LLG96_05140 [bacterium]|nr:hypothetical protein [bacterium]
MVQMIMKTVYGTGNSMKNMVGILVVMACVSGFVPAAVAENAPVWNPAWKFSMEVIVQETAGIDRIQEPVECEIALVHPMKSGDVKTVPADIRREVRVVRCTAEKRFIEISSQVYDIRAGAKNVKSDPPTVAVRARVVFMADVKALSSERYLVCCGNPEAKPPQYDTPMTVTGKDVFYTIDNPMYRIITEEKSGQIDEIDLKFATKPSLRFKYGTLHWNPDFIVVPGDFPMTGYTWWYAHHFDKPEYEVESGPVFFSIKRRQLIPGQDTAYMEVYYRFYAGLPYFISETLIEAKKDTRTFAIRNDELAFGRNDFNLVGWRNKTPDMFESHLGEIGSTGLYYEGYHSGHVLGSALPPNMAWISMFNRNNGYGVGSIRLEWENINRLTGEPSPLYNSHTVISEHDEGLYWFRSLIYSPRAIEGVSTDELEKYLVRVPKGSSYREKNAYVMYASDKDNPFGPIDDLWMKLRKPLQVKVIQPK